MLSLELESHQGYPQVISIEAFRNPRGASVTVLRTIREDLRIPFSNCELSKLGVEDPTGINTAFGAKCKREEESSRGPRRIGRLELGKGSPWNLCELTDFPWSLFLLVSPVLSRYRSRVAGTSRNPV